MSPNSKTLHLASEEETKSLGAALAALSRKGDCFLLVGPIGAGKSTLARAFIQALLGQNIEVPSPTFTLVQIYDGPEAEIWHADLYRLGDAQEAYELGLIDAMENDICLIEWPEILGELAPENSLTIELSVEGEAHRAVLTGGTHWHDRVAGLADDA